MKLNKILMAAAAVFAATAFTGCIKEVLPKESTITESQLGASDVGVESMLKSIPSAMAATYAYGLGHSDFGYHSIGIHKDASAMTLVTCVQVDRGGNPLYSWPSTPGYGYGMSTNGSYTHYIWYNYYPYIKKANDVIGVIKEANKETYPKIADETMNQYLGIAKAFRALFYLDLTGFYDNLYAYAPALNDYNGAVAKVEGRIVPIVTEDTTEDADEYDDYGNKGAKYNHRASRERMFQFIFDDLKDAEARLAKFESTTPVYPELPAIYGLFARAYMWLGQFEEGRYSNKEGYEDVLTGNAAYEKALYYAEKAIEKANVPVMSREEWSNTATGFNTVVPSWIWATTMSSDTVLNNLLAFVAHMSPEASYGYGPHAGHGVSKSMYDRLSDTDIRKKLIAGPDKTYDLFQRYTTMPKDEWEELAYRAPYVNFKFRPNQGERVDYMLANAISLPIMRIDEMYFIAMEAKALTDKVADAKEDLWSYMSNRSDNYILPTSDDPIDVVEEIIFQKSVEFWGEGVILFDMKRLNMGVKTTGQNYPPDMLFETPSVKPILDRAYNANPGAQHNRISWWNLPIPAGETAVNTATKNEAGPDSSRGVRSQDAI